MRKIIRTATIPLTLNTFCRGFLAELSKDYEVLALSSPGKELDSLALNDGIRTIAVPIERHISPLKDFIALCRLIRAFKKEHPDLVHSMTPKAGLLSMMAAKIVGVPLRVHTFTGLVFPTSKGFTKRLLMLTDRVTSACATHIIPEGEGIKDDLERFGITKKPMSVLGYGNIRGIDLKYYNRDEDVLDEATKLRKSLKIPDNAFTFIFVGRLVADKGINELVEAFFELCSLRKNLHLLLVGDEEKEFDPLSQKTIRIINDLKEIHKVGWQEDVRAWYAIADALVFPSYREGFPNVVIEAGAMSLPSIVTDINGSREIIKSGKNGLVISPRDKNALMEAMRELFDNRKRTSQMANKARELVASRYEQGYVRQCQKDFYASIFNKKS